MSQPTLDEILENLVVVTANQYGGYEGRDGETDRDIYEAKQQLTQIIADIIGKDDEPRNTIEHSRINFLRREQRQRAKGLGVGFDSLNFKSK